VRVANEVDHMKIRRIVTGRNGDGKSCFVAQHAPPRSHDFAHIAGMHVSQVWSTPPLPVIPADFSDPTITQLSLVPARGGTQFLMVAFPPDTVMQSPAFDAAAAGAENLEHVPGLAQLFEAEHPGMHTTDTIDYGIVLAGKISLELDDGQMQDLGPYDVVIQNGTRHAWRNRGTQPALMAFVLIGAKRQP
jgi:hypothetical protein